METGQKITQTNSNIDKLSNLELSIQVSLNGLSFCILNNKDNAFCYLNQVIFEKKQTPNILLDKLIDCLNNTEELKQPFSKIHVIHENELSSLIPKTLFNEEHIADYLKFNSRILQSDYITYDEILANESVNVYVPYVNINNFLYDTFGTFEFKHFSTILIESLLVLEKNSEDLKMYVHVATNHFEIIVIDSGKLVLYNSYEHHTKEDFIYYILFVAEQLELNPEAFKLILIGNISENDTYFNVVYKYVRHISVENKNSFLDYSDSISDNIKYNHIILNSF